MRGAALLRVFGLQRARPPVHLVLSQWFIGPGGCGATVAGIYINDAAGDLAALTGRWADLALHGGERRRSPSSRAPTEAPTPLARTGRWLEGAPCNASPCRAPPIKAAGTACMKRAFATRRDSSLHLPRLQQFGTENLVKR